MTQRDSSETEDTDDEQYREASLLSAGSEAGAERSASPGDRFWGEHIRQGLGLTPRQWMVLVSFALFLPYPAFVYILFTTSIDETLFLAMTLVYSLFAIFANLKL